jgi:MULE transposase domain
MCPQSLQYLQSHHDVLLIDNTYSTNRFDMPLIDIVGINYNNKSFFVAFAFLSDQSEVMHKWALTQLRGLFNSNNIEPPSAISTDCDQGL